VVGGTSNEVGFSVTLFSDTTNRFDYGSGKTGLDALAYKAAAKDIHSFSRVLFSGVSSTHNTQDFVQCSCRIIHRTFRTTR
jgi:hypothetical protein